MFFEEFMKVRKYLDAVLREQVRDWVGAVKFVGFSDEEGLTFESSKPDNKNSTKISIISSLSHFMM